MRSLLCLSVVTALLALAGPASAASLTLSGQPADVSQPLGVQATGSADGAGRLQVFGEINGTTCAATAQEHLNTHQSMFSQYRDVGAGPFDLRLEMPAGQAQPGKYLFCGYLVQHNQTGPPTNAAAAVFGPVSYSSRPCPPAAFTIDGVGLDTASSATIKVTVPADGMLRVTGDDGSLGSAQATGSGTYTLTTGSNAMGEAIRHNKSFTATYTVTFNARPTDGRPCARPDGTESYDGVTETRTVTHTFPPRPPEPDRTEGGMKICKLVDGDTENERVVCTAIVQTLSWVLKNGVLAGPVTITKNGKLTRELYLTVKGKKILIGTGKQAVKAGTKANPKIALTAKGKKALKLAGKRAKLSVKTTMAPASGAKKVTSKAFKLAA